MVWQIVSWLQSLSNACPPGINCKLYSIGKTYDGNHIYVFKVSLVICFTLIIKTQLTTLPCIYSNCNCNCKYDKLYSTVGGKPLPGCFTRMFTVSTISNARDYRSSTVSTIFLKAGRVLVSRIVAIVRKTVPRTRTNDLKGSIAHFSLGSWHTNIRRVWWPQPWPAAATW